MFAIAFPHRLMVDDIYDGVFLPKGTQVRLLALILV